MTYGYLNYLNGVSARLIVFSLFFSYVIRHSSSFFFVFIFFYQQTNGQMVQTGPVLEFPFADRRRIDKRLELNSKCFDILTIFQLSCTQYTSNNEIALVESVQIKITKEKKNQKQQKLQIYQK